MMRPEVSMNKEHRKNRLAGENSPYLLQHACNPVDWYPWGDEAFEKAVNEDKPVFLSIGYSTCHWCHVMEHESFEDPEVAELMNEAFVSVKVDREERPDIDKLYMSACQIMTGSGGWPLTIIMTPEKRPFLAATYVPRENRYGRIGMLELIPRVRNVWVGERAKLEEFAGQISAALGRLSSSAPGSNLDHTLLRRAFTGLRASFDPQSGGFGSAPKFPTPHNLLFLLRYWKRTGDDQALQMVEKTLSEMKKGGIYDHVGFGFHRYSTDPSWSVPHFEKMLYDQALISMAYADAYQATGKGEYRDAVEEIFEYVLRDMTSPEGAFLSAEDADSECEEGKFYVWTIDELASLFSEEEMRILRKVYGLKSAGNFAEESTGKRTGANILHMTGTPEDLGETLGIEVSRFRAVLKNARKRLFERRLERVHPLKDDKILADWNGLMISALAKGARVLGETRYADAARNAVEFILENMRDGEGRLFHRYRQGEAAKPSHLDDYAFLSWGLVELYETTFEPKYLERALEIVGTMLSDFWDMDQGGFYFSDVRTDALPARTKDIYDGAVPSGNSVAMLVLLKLGRMLANPEFEGRADEIGKAFSQRVSEGPAANTQLMVALDFAVGPSTEVVIVGDPRASETNDMIQAIRQFYLPNTVILLKPIGPDGSRIARLAPFVESFKPTDGLAAAYVCSNHVCRLPTTDVAEMLTQLGVTP
jgi:uncharacterized protein YyaL (SSP411 family)